jgi:hypothetical protein
VGGYRRGAVEVGYRARDLQDARVGACAQTEAVDGELAQSLQLPVEKEAQPW